MISKISKETGIHKKFIIVLETVLKQ